MIKPAIYKTRPKLSGKINVIDAYSSAVEELFFLKNPSLKKGGPQTRAKLLSFKKKSGIKPCWVFYPQNRCLVRTVNEGDYLKLRTARNKNLITEKEQKNFRNLTVGVAALSVGSSVLAALVAGGGPRQIKIADFDNLEITNLNRIRARLWDVGRNKTVIAANEVWALDPFAKLWLFEKGISQKNLKDFLLKKPAVSVFVDQMDSL